MPEDVLFSFEQSMDRSEIAAYLRRVADTLDSGEELVLEAGEQQVRMSPPARPTFEVKAEHEYPSSGGPGEYSVELEIEWDENASDDSSAGGLQIG